MTNTKKNEIKAEFDRDLIKINVNIAMKRQYIGIAILLVISALVVSVVLPNDDLRKFLLEILIGILQLIWANRQK